MTRLEPRWQSHSLELHALVSAQSSAWLFHCITQFKKRIKFSELEGLGEWYCQFWVDLERKPPGTPRLCYWGCGMGTPLPSLLPFSDRQKCTQTLFESCPETVDDCGGLLNLCGAGPHHNEIRQTALTQDPVPVLSSLQPRWKADCPEKTIAVISRTTSYP